MSARAAVTAALAKGLTPDARSRAAGEERGLRGEPPDVPDWADRYSYFLGYASGAAARHTAAAFFPPPQNQEDA